MPHLIQTNSFEIISCSGLTSKNCPNVLPYSIEDLNLAQAIQDTGWPNFLSKQIHEENIKPHNKFRISISGCVNGCSQPYIFDFALIRAITPKILDKKCNLCQHCLKICQEQALQVKNSQVIITNNCIRCGSCYLQCPYKAIISKDDGFKVFIGGHLGRSPRLARQLPGLYSIQEVVAILQKCLHLYQKHFSQLKRFGDIFNIYPKLETFYQH
ncbi:MAG: 4Fe-4S binding protein [Desulfonauticus sp.]|nr:4Fe-4S binding protein [Desulfonauticus sp.]